MWFFITSLWMRRLLQAPDTTLPVHRQRLTALLCDIKVFSSTLLTEEPHFLFIPYQSHLQPWNALKGWSWLTSSPSSQTLWTHSNSRTTPTDPLHTASIHLDKRNTLSSGKYSDPLTFSTFCYITALFWIVWRQVAQWLERWASNRKVARSNRRADVVKTSVS